MPTDQLTGLQHSFRPVFSVTSVCTLCREVTPQDFRHLHWPCWSRRIITLCWDSKGSNRDILLVSDNQNRFLVIIYCIKRDFEVRKCTGRASGPDESRSLEVSFNCCGRTFKITSECRTEFVFRLCEISNTRTSRIGLLCFIYLVTVIYSNILSKLKCRTRDLRTYSDAEALWFSSSNHAVALLENNNATLCVGRGGLLLVLQFEAVTLDPSNFSLFSFRPPAMDLTTAYRYNQNMMEYYTCKSKS
jgi:hypothetical protein